MEKRKKAIELSLNTIVIVVLILVVVIVSLFVFIPFFTKNTDKLKKGSPSTNIKNLSKEITNEFN
jgi:predicted PurR-regulated permease PerM